MKDQSSLRRLVQTVSLLLLTVLCLPAIATADDWELRASGQWVTTSVDAFADLDDGTGLYLGLERRLTDRWGVELGLGWNQLDGSDVQSFDSGTIRIESRFEEELEWLPLSLAGNFHLTPDAGFDVYVSGRVGWAFFDDLKIKTSQTIELGPPFGTIDSQADLELATEDAFFYGVRLGFDRPFGTSGWAFSATVDWTALELEIDTRSAFGPVVDDPLPGEIPITPVKVDLDPITVGVGVSKRF